MVDFNNESTVSVAPDKLIAIIIIQYWAESIDNISFFRKKTDPQQSDIVVLRSKVEQLRHAIDKSLKENMKPEEYTQLLERLESEDYKDIILAFEQINDYLYDKKLIKFDNKRTKHPWLAVRRNADIEGYDD